MLVSRMNVQILTSGLQWLITQYQNIYAPLHSISIRNEGRVISYQFIRLTNYSFAYGIINNLFPMLRFLIAALCISSAFAATILSNNCPQQISFGFSQFRNALTQPDVNKMIDAIAKTSLLVPDILGSCLGKSAAASYEHEVSKECVNDLSKAAKIGVRILNETDNDLKVARDVAILERLVQTKVKKDCVFLQDLSIENIKSKGECMESAYRLSLVVEQLSKDAAKGDKKSAMKDIDTIITNLPDTLDLCGQADWAQKIRKYLPTLCVHALESLVQELGVVEHNYEHLEWLAKHYKEIEAAFGNVKKSCPLFK